MKAERTIRNSTYGGHFSRCSQHHNTGKGQHRIDKKYDCRAIHQLQQHDIDKTLRQNNVKNLWKTCPQRTMTSNETAINNAIIALVAISALGTPGSL